MASCSTFFLCNHAAAAPWSPSSIRTRRSFQRRNFMKATINAKLDQTALQYKKLGDSDLVISEKEAHEILSYAFENGIKSLDTAEVYPVPMKKETG